MDKNIQNINNNNEKGKSNIINIEEKLKLLEAENLSLKNQLNISLEKEKLYHSTVEKIKKMQTENEKSYFDSLKENKKREEEIQKKYLEFQKMLESQYEENEKRLNEQIKLLTQELTKGNNKINFLTNNIDSLKEKISQDELNYHLKEKKFENVIKIKERKLEELNIAVKQITKEATEEIKRLSEQLEDFQQKTKNANSVELNGNNINNNMKTSLNKFKNEIFY
jgi:chromosome segregation ATPase